MKDLIGGILATIGVVGGLVVAFAILIFYSVAFIEGADSWFGWEGWWVGMLFFAVVFFFRGFGLTLLLIVGGYGAYNEWDWPLWIVVPVFFPGIAMIVGGLLFAGLSSIFSREPA